MAIASDPTIRRQVIASARAVLRDDPRAAIRDIVERAGVSRATFYRHFGSRDALLEAVAVEPPPPARERIVRAAAELIGPYGLSGFSMETLAATADVSRATLYRLFPSKAAIFGALLQVHSPFREMQAIIARRFDDPPEVVFPEVVRAIARIGHPRIGILRTLILEASTANAEAVEGARSLLPEVISRYLTYVTRQMDAGHMRRMHPVLAMQCLIGPVAFHLLSRPVAERLVDVTMPVEEAAEEIGRAALGGLLLSPREAPR